MSHHGIGNTHISRTGNSEGQDLIFWRRNGIAEPACLDTRQSGNVYDNSKAVDFEIRKRCLSISPLESIELRKARQELQLNKAKSCASHAPWCAWRTTQMAIALK